MFMVRDEPARIWGDSKMKLHEVTGATNVVTYTFAYMPGGRIDLCDKHADHPPATLPPLGEVHWGGHEGNCEVCSFIAEYGHDRI
jgi:hypothetical protein